MDDPTGGIDVGGTKIEARIFSGPGAMSVAVDRVATPGDPAALRRAILDRIAWADALAGHPIRVGLAVPGLLDPATGAVFAANVAFGRTPLGPDIAARASRPVPVLNDGAAFALSEARGGAGAGTRVVLGLVLGTGIGGGVAVDGHPLPGHAGYGLEIGHVALPATAAQRHGLPLRDCPCGRTGCLERYASGSALPWLARHLTGREDLSEPVLRAWADILAEALRPVLFALDPGAIVLGGGLSGLPGMAEQLAAALDRHRLGPARLPAVMPARFGATSGARGAALHARDKAC